MDYKEFCETIKEDIKNFLPEQFADYDVTLHAVSKPNIGQLVGLTFAAPKKGIPCPVIYLEPYYDAYLNKGMSTGRIMSQIAIAAAEGIEKGRSAVPGMMDTIPDMGSWEQVKDLVTVRVVGVTRNTDLLQEVPFRIHGDIAMIYQVNMEAPDRSLMTVRITNEMMDHYGVTEPQLYETAMENSKRIQKVTCRPIGDVIGDLLGAPPDETMGQAEKLYVLTNETAQFGAAALFYPGVIDTLAKNIPEGFYILPSSIHEVLILPKNQAEKDMLEAMVQEINATQVAPEDVLSDFVSEYDAKKHIMKWGEDPNFTLPEQLQEKVPMLPKEPIR